jgi:hypothetical protein
MAVEARGLGRRMGDLIDDLATWADCHLGRCLGFFGRHGWCLVNARESCAVWGRWGEKKKSGALFLARDPARGRSVSTIEYDRCWYNTYVLSLGGGLKLPRKNRSHMSTRHCHMPYRIYDMVRRNPRGIQRFAIHLLYSYVEYVSTSCYPGIYLCMVRIIAA